MDLNEKNDLLEDLMSDLRRQDKAYELQGPQMLTIKRHDGTYRNKECYGTDFLPETARMGAKGSIFVFEPEDPQDEFVVIEVKVGEMDDTFPLFLEDVKDWAMRRFTDRNAERIKIIEGALSVPGLIGSCFFFEEEDMANTALTDDTEMASLPTFGLF